MPELPEVEAVISMLRPEAVGAVIRRVDVLRVKSIQPQDESALAATHGKRIESIDRRGKNILLRLSGGLTLRVHLRMSGILRVIPDARLHTANTRVLFTFKDRRGLAFEDHRVMGTVHVLTEAELEKKLRPLGPEPFTRAFSVSYLVSAAGRSSKPVKVFLMNQNVVAGLGNIYAAESLFEARIHPAKPANQVSEQKLRGLHAAIRKVLRRSIRDAAKTYSRPDRHEGMRFRVYGRRNQLCFVCGKPIQRMEQDGRSTYFCATCQRK